MSRGTNLAQTFYNDIYTLSEESAEDYQQQFSIPKESNEQLENTSPLREDNTDEQKFSDKKIARNPISSLNSQIENSINPVTHISPREHFVVLKKFEGKIIAITPESGEITVQTHEMAQKVERYEEAVISMEEIPEDDRDLIALGAVFYWYIGYHDTIGGTRRRTSKIQFQRLPQWSRHEIAKYEEKRKALIKAFTS